MQCNHKNSSFLSHFILVRRCLQSTRMGDALLATCFVLSLSSCGGGGGAPASNAAVVAALTVTNASVIEGNAGTTNLVFTVTSSIPASSAIAVSYTTADGTALAGQDYTGTSGTLNIAIGASSGTISVAVLGDTVVEADETFTLVLTVPANATIAGGTITGTILNDDHRLNDTGITTWDTATVNNLTVTQVTFPGQDADHGRDALAAATTLVKTGGGNAGFDFTKLDAAGQPLANQAAVYANTPWSCVQDNVTGMMWEVKTTGGLGGLHDANHTYTWFNSTGINDGGNAGTANGGVCVDAINCDTEKYVAAVNAAGLCGFKDWRLPRKEALRSIVDYSVASFGNAIDLAYFPNSGILRYWSSSPYAGSAPNAWNVFFNSGVDGAYLKSGLIYVRLVRGGQ